MRIPVGVITAVAAAALFNLPPSLAQVAPLHPETGEPLFALPFSEIVNNGSLMCSQEFYLNGDWFVPGDCIQLDRRLGEEQRARDLPETGPVGWRGGSCLSHTIEFSSDGTYFQQTIQPLDGGGITREYSGTYALDSQGLRLICETSVFMGGRDRVENSCFGYDPRESFYYLPVTYENPTGHGIAAYGEYAGNDIRIYSPTNPRERISCSTSPITLQAAVEAASAVPGAVVSADNDTEEDIESNCDYSAADFNSGWGWDSITGESCAPLQVEETVDSDCDYTDAALNDGWGWNPVDGVSCPPS